jgi:proteasome lid subunit RPN8/RPN11
MSFSIRATIRDLVAPDHYISCPSRLWQAGLTELKQRGMGCRESGAFLLGRREGDKRRIARIIYYDELDPHCLDTGIVIFDGAYFGDLWKICRETSLDVLADVHTHPGQPIQSGSDRENPMVGTKGHIAIIVPNLAMQPVKTHQLGVYEYRGNHTWQAYLGRDAAKFLYIGRW